MQTPANSMFLICLVYGVNIESNVKLVPLCMFEKKSVMISVAHALNSNHIYDGIVNTLKPVLIKSIKTT